MPPVFVSAKSAEIVPIWAGVFVWSNDRPTRARKSSTLVQFALNAAPTPKTFMQPVPVPSAHSS